MSSITSLDLKQPIASFGLSATLVTRAEVSAEVVEKLTTALLRGVSALRKVHPALRHVQPEQMIATSNFAPRHKGAQLAIDAFNHKDPTKRKDPAEHKDPTKRKDPTE